MREEQRQCRYCRHLEECPDPGDVCRDFEREPGSDDDLGEEQE